MAGRGFRNKSKEQIVTGVGRLDRKLKKFGTSAANRIARAGLLAGARAAAKDIKKSIPARLKSVRAAIGHSVKKSGGQKGVTTAKAGAAVGKAGKRKTKRSTPKTGNQGRTAGGQFKTFKSAGGVGITRDNVHWWFLGTGDRSDKVGRDKGRMPMQDIVKQAFKASAIKKIIFVAGKKVFKRESLKLKKKRR